LPGKQISLFFLSDGFEEPVTLLFFNLPRKVSDSSEPRGGKEREAFFEFRRVRRACGSSLLQPSKEGFRFIRTKRRKRTRSVFRVPTGSKSLWLFSSSTFQGRFQIHQNQEVEKNAKRFSSSE